MSDLDGLVPWLHEQLDAREKTARAAADAVDGTEWSPLEGGGVAARGPRGVTVALGPDGYMASAVDDHIAVHDPACVLRAVAAKRRVIVDYEDAERTLSVARPGTPPHDIMTGATNTLRRMLRLFATEYADRPGYREEWRP